MYCSNARADAAATSRSLTTRSVYVQRLRANGYPRLKCTVGRQLVAVKANEILTERTHLNNSNKAASNELLHQFVKLGG